jgi:hypothetical protein
MGTEFIKEWTKQKALLMQDSAYVPEERIGI